MPGSENYPGSHDDLGISEEQRLAEVGQLEASFPEQTSDQSKSDQAFHDFVGTDTFDHLGRGKGTNDYTTLERTPDGWVAVDTAETPTTPIEEKHFGLRAAKRVISGLRNRRFDRRMQNVLEKRETDGVSLGEERHYREDGTSYITSSDDR